MSRVGKKPIIIPAGVEVTINGQQVMVKGPKGELSLTLHSKVKVERKENELIIVIQDQTDHRQRALWGLFRNLVNNHITGVTQGFTKQLEINGIGFKAEVKKDTLVLQVGFSHPVNYQIPKGIEIKVEKNLITVAGNDKQLVGQTAAEIRFIKKPEPYKGKGIKYVDEVIRRKAGKAAVKGE